MGGSASKAAVLDKNALYDDEYIKIVPNTIELKGYYWNGKSKIIQTSDIKSFVI